MTGRGGLGRGREREPALRRIDGRGDVVAHRERLRPDHHRLGDAFRIGGIAAGVELVAVEEAVLVAVDAEPDPGARRDAREGAEVPA
jgi:hypothetical protein